jgi:HAD superfamily hydrolase (TIGR01509 family)
MSKNIFHFMRGKSIKAVLFDLDGTLFDSEVGSIEMMKDLILEKTGTRPSTSFEELTGLNYGDKMTKMLGYVDEDLIKIAMLQGSKIYSKIAEPFAGVNNALVSLKENGIRLAVCTNGDIRLSRPVFEKVDVEMDLYQGTGGGLNKKPEPDVYLEALKAFEINPSDALVVEDSFIGVSAALAAGIPEDNILVFDMANLHEESTNRFTSWVEFSQDDRAETR